MASCYFCRCEIPDGQDEWVVTGSQFGAHGTPKRVRTVCPRCAVDANKGQGIGNNLIFAALAVPLGLFVAWLLRQLAR